MGATDTAWERRACIDEPDLFTPSDDKILNCNPAWLTPRSICRECPILAECQEWIIGQSPDPCPLSMVAGLTPAQRSQIRANGLRTRCGTVRGRKDHALLGEKPCDACRAARNANDRARAAS